MPLKILTANRVVDGNTVWLSASGTWVGDIGAAFIARHEEAVKALEESGRIASTDHRVVNASTIEVEEVGTHIHPKRLRMRTRAEDPGIGDLPTAGEKKWLAA